MGVPRGADQRGHALGYRGGIQVGLETLAVLTVEEDFDIHIIYIYQSD